MLAILQVRLAVGSYTAHLVQSHTVLKVQRLTGLFCLSLTSFEYITLVLYREGIAIYGTLAGLLMTHHPRWPTLGHLSTRLKETELKARNKLFVRAMSTGGIIPATPNL